MNLLLLITRNKIQIWSSHYIVVLYVINYYGIKTKITIELSIVLV